MFKVFPDLLVGTMRASGRRAIRFAAAVGFLGVGITSAIVNTAFADNPNNNTGGNATLNKLDCTADQIAKFDGVEWRCAVDQTGSTVIIRDSNDEAVATILIIGTVAKIEDVEGRVRNILVQVFPSNIFVNNAFATVSTDPACAGTQYVSVALAEASLGAPFSSVAEPVYATCPVGCGIPVPLYIPSSDEPILLPGPVYSVNNSGGVCWLFSEEDVLVYAAEDVSSQISGIGTPPFYWDLK